MISRAGEGVADQAEPAFGVEAVAVIADDACRFLATMLERMQAKRRDCGSFRMAENAEHAAFFAQAVAIDVEVEIPVVPVAALVRPIAGGTMVELIA